MATARGHSTDPYDILNRFSESMPEEESTEDLPARMARLLAEGTGAAWAQVWVDRWPADMTLAATWPAGVDANKTPPGLLPEARDARWPGRCAPWP